MNSFLIYNIIFMHNNQYQEDRDQTCYESCLSCFGATSGCLRIYVPFPCCCCRDPVVKLSTFQGGILQRFGKFKKRLEPGLNIINPVTQSVLAVDMRTKVGTLSKQPILTKDNVTVGLETVVYYRVVDPVKVAYKLGVYERESMNFISEMAHAAMRTVGGQHTLQDILQNRGKIAQQLARCVEGQVEPWGLFIENIFIKDLYLDKETESNLSSVAKQKRIAQATIISAKADVQAAKMMKQASELLDSKAAMQIRYLEVVQELAHKPNPKVLFLSLKGKQ